MQKNFDELVCQVIVDGLEVLKGKEMDCGYIGVCICEAMNKDKHYTSNIYVYFNEYCELESFVRDNWDEAAEASQNWRGNTGEVIDVFEEADKLVYLMIEDEVSALLDGTEFVNENNTIVLTDEAIAQLIEELDLEDVQVSEWLRDDEEQQATR